MATPVQKAISAAFMLFSRQNYQTITNENLREIIYYFNQVSKAELQLCPSLLIDRIPSVNDPPVTYIRILENKVGIIIMRVVYQQILIIDSHTPTVVL